MAANKFATMLHRKTNKITLILIYAVLEWILIALLLLNSLFSYLIIKFAEFFGLKPPCPWCTKLDHIFNPEKGNKNMHTDHLCEVHAKEISRLRFCFNHHKLAESQDMCEDCLYSKTELQGFSSHFALVSWFKEVEVIENHEEMVGENGGVSLCCSCCGVSLDNTLFSSYVLLKISSWDVFGCAKKENLITKAGYVYDGKIQLGFDSDEKRSDFGADFCDDEKVLEDKNQSEMLFELYENIEVSENVREENTFISVLSVKEMKESEAVEDENDQNEVLKMNVTTENVREKDKSVQACVKEDAPLEISSQHLEFFLDDSGHELVPIETVNLITEESQSKDNEDDDNVTDQCLSNGCEIQVEEKEDLVSINRSKLDGVHVVLDVDLNEEPKFSMLEYMEMEEDENSLVFHAKDCHLMMDEFEQFNNFAVSPFFPSEDVSDVQEMDVAAGEMHLYIHTACEDVAPFGNNENEADVSIGTDIPDLDITDEIQNQESCEYPSTSSANLYEADDQVEEEMVEFQCSSIQNKDQAMNNQPSVQLELNVNEEDKVPDAPSSVDNLSHLHKEFLFLTKRDYGTEESFDGSVSSELEVSDGVLTVEHLKSVLREERKILQALYAELEEERNASEEAANQTMAMINRLQEEKAAMKMEAFQYHRMMEEQSEYDQEALQLLNELMVKGEEEKKELEKELEVYKRKILDYETKENVGVFKKSNRSARSGFSSADFSTSEDSDGLSVDLNRELKEEEGFYRHKEFDKENTPVDRVIIFEECLSDFEDERLSILGQLKILEEKLVTLDDDKNQQFENGLYEENGNHVDVGEANAHETGFVKEMNGKHNQKRRIGGHKGKSLRPLFDAISEENGNGLYSNVVHNPYESRFGTGDKKIDIEEDVDHLYERLQALEADREFFKHGVSSLRKGDQGMGLLQEILHHLLDLRNMELRVRNLRNGSTV